MKDILNTCMGFNMWNKVIDAMNSRARYSNMTWKQSVWEKANDIEQDNWYINMRSNNHNNVLAMNLERPSYSVGFSLPYINKQIIRQCETMVKISWNARKLKANDVRLNRLPISNRMCANCDLGVIGNLKHIIMDCTYIQNKRWEMVSEHSILKSNIE